jgi:hypothetical protein
MGRVEVPPTNDRVLDEAVERDYDTLCTDPMPSGLITVSPIAFWNGLTRISTACRGIGIRRFADQVGSWSIDFNEKLQRRRSLHYALSGSKPCQGENRLMSAPNENVVFVPSRNVVLTGTD